MKNSDLDKDSNNTSTIMCPECGSTNLTIRATDFLVGPPFRLICKDCSNTWKYDTKISFAEPDKLNLFQRLVEKIW